LTDRTTTLTVRTSTLTVYVIFFLESYIRLLRVFYKRTVISSGPPKHFGMAPPSATPRPFASCDDERTCNQYLKCAGTVRYGVYRHFYKSRTGVPVLPQVRMLYKSSLTSHYCYCRCSYVKPLPPSALLITQFTMSLHTQSHFPAVRCRAACLVRPKAPFLRVKRTFKR